MADLWSEYVSYFVCLELAVRKCRCRWEKRGWYIRNPNSHLCHEGDVVDIVDGLRRLGLKHGDGGKIRYIADGLSRRKAKAGTGVSEIFTLCFSWSAKRTMFS